MRCFGDHWDVYARYHDEEWGVPVHDDRHLFEMISLEGQQAGLSWELILRKRDAYRRAFHNFDPSKVAAMTDCELDALLGFPEVVRNRLKIYSVRKNARTVLLIQEEWGSLDAYFWSFVDGEPIVNRWKSPEEIPCLSPLSEALSRDLKRRGMSFVGPKIVYSFMQAVGMIDDHPQTCWKRKSQRH